MRPSGPDGVKLRPSGDHFLFCAGLGSPGCGLRALIGWNCVQADNIFVYLGPVDWDVALRPFSVGCGLGPL